MDKLFKLFIVLTFVAATIGLETCILPAYPDDGGYTVGGEPNAAPGGDLDSAFLNITCNQGFSVSGKNLVYCVNGKWSSAMPRCVRSCNLPTHPSVEYRCLITGQSMNGTRQCQGYEPLGTLVAPRCRANYWYIGVLPMMRCVDGAWDHVAVCSPECGIQSADKGVHPSEPARFPWHVVIYKKDSGGHRQICGGTVISNYLVITAAHCFVNEVKRRQPRPTMYAAAAGKTKKSWDEMEQYEQKFNISEIIIPERFQGAATNYQDDIALVKLSSALEYTVRVRPACLDFDYEFDSRQLQAGKYGQISTWGASVDPNPSLTVIQMEYITTDQCLSRSPMHFKEYITSDKICAGYGNGTSFCVGNSGSGLVFAEEQRGVTRHYLRGLASTAPSRGETCLHDTFTAFTHIANHEHFIKEHYS